MRFWPVPLFAVTLMATLGSVQAQAPVPGVWYYCDPTHAYYPYVRECAVAWREVPAGSYDQNQYHAEPTSSAPRTQPESTPPRPVESQQQRSAAYLQGQTDRLAWEAWFATLTGDNRAGAEYWAANRSLPNPGSCSLSSQSEGSDWASGCFAAQKRLAVPDVRRKTEPAYRLGWNSPPATPAPETSSTSNDRPATAPKSDATEKPQTESREASLPNYSADSKMPDESEDSSGSTGSRSCKENWKDCKDNEDLVNNWAEYFKVQADCQMEAEKDALYGTPVWPGFWSGGAFGSFLRGKDYVLSGIVTSIEPNAQFQNAFGAMVHSTVYCKYDLKSGKVADVSIIPH